MGNITKAFKDAKATFKMSMVSYKAEMACKRSLDKILDAYAIMPEYIRGGRLREYVLSEIELFETVYGTEYLRKSELETVGQPIPTGATVGEEDCCENVTFEFDDDGSITVAEEYHE